MRDVGRLDVGRCYHRGRRRRDHQDHQGHRRDRPCAAGSRHQDERHRDHQHRQDEARTYCHQHDLQVHQRQDGRYLEVAGLADQKPTSGVRRQEVEELGDPLVMWAVVEALHRGRWER